MYWQCFFKQIPYATLLIREFKQIYVMECKIMYNNGKLHKQYEKWYRIKLELEQSDDFQNDFLSPNTYN